MDAKDSASAQDEEVYHFMTSQQASQSEDSSASGTTRLRRGSRTSNACEQCQRRKTKCSGQPSPCEACDKIGLVCHFETRPNLRSRLKITYSAEDGRLQYLLNGILSMIKHNDDTNLGNMVDALRQDRPPSEIAAHLRRNLNILQEQGVISKMGIDDNDLIALATRISVGYDPAQASSLSDINPDTHIDHRESARFLQDYLQSQSTIDEILPQTANSTLENSPNQFYQSRSMEGLTAHPAAWNTWQPDSMATAGLHESFGKSTSVSTPINPTSWYAMQRQSQYQGFPYHTPSGLTDNRLLPQQHSQQLLPNLRPFTSSQLVHSAVDMNVEDSYQIFPTWGQSTTIRPQESIREPTFTQQYTQQNQIRQPSGRAQDQLLTDTEVGGIPNSEVDGDDICAPQ